jgi:hypothetical protein
MRDHTKLRAFELADEGAMLVHRVTAGLSKEEVCLESCLIAFSLQPFTFVLLPLPFTLSPLSYSSPLAIERDELLGYSEIDVYQMSNKPNWIRPR